MRHPRVYFVSPEHIHVSPEYSRVPPAQAEHIRVPPESIVAPPSNDGYDGIYSDWINISKVAG